jgi:hypothetical protein
MTREQIKNAALELDPADREILAEEILLSISNHERSAVDEAWLTEIRRRDAAKPNGKPIEEVIERLRNKARP